MLKAILSSFTSLFLAIPAAAQCPGDVAKDGIVNGTDIAALLSVWGTNGQGAFDADINGDGIVEGADLTILLVAWGACVQTPAWATLIEALPDPAVVYDEVQRAAIIATGLAWRVKDTATQMEMLLIPPGTFNMGCSASTQHQCHGDENPVHEVTLTEAFYLGRYEVTQAQWQATMGNNPSYFQSASSQVPAAEVSNRPVERVSWNTIQGYQSATGMRLPTEAEWEYACRGGTTTAFHGWPANPSGTNDDNQGESFAWSGYNSSGETRPVGGKSGNGFGLHDMSGNVCEWTNDWYGDYSDVAQTNPQGSLFGSCRVVRGGGWMHIFVRSSDRGFGCAPTESFDFVGFRSARSPESYETPAVTGITPAAGVDTGGSVITIYGSLRGGTTAVAIGGVPATNVQVVNASTVTAVTPPAEFDAVSDADTLLRLTFNEALGTVQLVDSGPNQYQCERGAVGCGATCCPGDVIPNGLVDGVDLAALLIAWGTSGGDYPRSDTNEDGIVDGGDLAVVLTAWGPCLD